MAYCKNCGAYIPDGNTKCLACGYDEAEEEKNAAKKSYESGAAADYGFSTEKIREEGERLREEIERQRRQQRDRRWAEEEYARRQKEKERQAESYVNRDAERDYGYGQTRSENRTLAALSYLSILFILPHFACPDDEFAKYHARQGLVLFVFGIISDIIASIIPVGWLITLFRLYCIYKGMTNASAGRREPLPYIGKYGLR